MLSFQQQQNANTNGVSTTEQATPAATIQSMRLREEPPPITPAPRNPRKRKSPSNSTEPTQVPPASQPIQHVLPPPHALIHPIPGSIPGYSYPPTDYTPGGLPPSQPPQPAASATSQQTLPSQATSAGRTLSQSKRAEQNRKAQRAFRERRDQHVKALESRSQLLDAALASADEANRRWEECRALVDQLRVENAALRAALSQAQLLPTTNTVTPATAPVTTASTVSEASASGTREEQTINSLTGEEAKHNEPRRDMKTNVKD